MTHPFSEEEVLATLRCLAARWPKTLWLFASPETLNVLSYGPNGERMMLPTEGVDPAFIVDTIDLPIDGGDW